MKLLTKIPKTYLFLGIVILLIVVISLLELINSKSANRPNNLAPSVNLSEKSNKLEKEEGDVDVVVEYLPEKSDNNNIVFNIVLDTHNVNLDSFDFFNDIELEKEGVVSIPIKSSPTGSVHHRKAEVVFKRINPPFSVVLLKLSSLPKREFQFINIK